MTENEKTVAHVSNGGKVIVATVERLNVGDVCSLALIPNIVWVRVVRESTRKAHFENAAKAGIAVVLGNDPDAMFYEVEAID
jgi:hypothetical protein